MLQNGVLRSETCRNNNSPLKATPPPPHIKKGCCNRIIIIDRDNCCRRPDRLFLLAANYWMIANLESFECACVFFCFSPVINWLQPSQYKQCLIMVRRMKNWNHCFTSHCMFTHLINQGTACDCAWVQSAAETQKCWDCFKCCLTISK